jgi:hypothetical protein
VRGPRKAASARTEEEKCGSFEVMVSSAAGLAGLVRTGTVRSAAPNQGLPRNAVTAAGEHAAAKRQGALVAGLSAAALVALVVAPFWLHTRERRARDRQQGSSASLEAGWVPLPGRRELILDLRKAAATSPAEPFASGALAQERMEAGARALTAGDRAGALRELDAAEGHLTRALHATDADPVILAAHGVCALLRDDALTYLARNEEAAEAREIARRDLEAASEQGTGDVRAVACWNQSLLEERRSLIAYLSGDSSIGEVAQDEADRARERALAAAEPGGALAALLAARSASR